MVEQAVSLDRITAQAVVQQGKEAAFQLEATEDRLNQLVMTAPPAKTIAETTEFVQEIPVAQPLLLVGRYVVGLSRYAHSRSASPLE